MTHYDILGVEKNASSDEIKKAYKTLAKEWHPDKNIDKPEVAKKKFQEIQEAYEILGDEDKRRLYDIEQDGGGVPPSFFPQSGNNMPDLMSMLFSSALGASSYGGGASSFGGVNHREPIKKIFTHELLCSLEELYFGCKKKIKISRNVYNRSETKILEIDIRKGWKDGTKLTFENEGDCNQSFTTDIIVIIREQRHNEFRREKDNLIIVRDITLNEAQNGTNITVKLLDNSTRTFKTNPLKYSDDQLEIPNCGMPTKNNTVGNLIIRFRIRLSS